MVCLTVLLERKGIFMMLGLIVRRALLADLFFKILIILGIVLADRYRFLQSKSLSIQNAEGVRFC